MKTCPRNAGVGYSDKSQIPKGPNAKHDAEGVLEILPDLEQGLTDIEGFSHLFVLWAFDRADGFDLMATPPTDTEPHGVFAARAPRRPKPIALTVVELLGREGNRLYVRGVDMLDGTPILDIKSTCRAYPKKNCQRSASAQRFTEAIPPSG